jgi:hypothetical protein
MNKILPVFRTNLKTNNIPWDVFNTDLDTNGDTTFKEIARGVSTVELGLRRDLEEWALGFRMIVCNLVKHFMPYIPTGNYEDWTQLSWINRVDPNGFTRYHDHKPCDMAIVWYIDVPDRSGNFILQYNGEDHVVEVTTGDVIAFPASLLHTTELNKSDRSRYVMATNVIWTETLRVGLRNKLTDNQVESQLTKLYNDRQTEMINNMETWYESNLT